MQILQVNTYGDCVKSLGSVLQESYPAMCVTKDGRSFIELISPTITESPTATPATATITTSTTIPGWKTWNDTSFGISFSFPNNLVMPVSIMVAPLPNTIVSFTDNVLTIPELRTLHTDRLHGPDDVWPIAIDKYKGDSLNEWIQQNTIAEKNDPNQLNKGSQYFPVSAYTMTKTTFHGYPAYKLQPRQPDKYNNLYATNLVQVGTIVYRIDYEAYFPTRQDETNGNSQWISEPGDTQMVQTLLDSIMFLTK